MRYGGMLSPDRDIWEPSQIITYGNDLLANCKAIRKRNRSCVAGEKGVSYEPLGQASVDFSDVSDDLPREVRWCVDNEFFVNRSHIHAS